MGEVIKGGDAGRGGDGARCDGTGAARGIKWQDETPGGASASGNPPKIGIPADYRPEKPVAERGRCMFFFGIAHGTSVMDRFPLPQFIPASWQAAFVAWDSAGLFGIRRIPYCAKGAKALIDRAARRPSIGARITAVAGLLLAAAMPGAASSLFSTDRMLEQGGNACVAAAHCRTLRQRPRWIEAGASETLTPHCPANHPYLWNWDAEYHEHIVATVVPASRATDRMTLAIANQGDARGSITVFLGCATEPPPYGTGFLQAVGAVPTNGPAFRTP